MIANALNDKPLPVYGTGENVRDWLYVEDHCKAIDLIIHNGRVGEVYNVGGHNEKTNLEIVKIICKELNKPESLITFVGDRKGHDMRYACLLYTSIVVKGKSNRKSLDDESRKLLTVTTPLLFSIALHELLIDITANE